MFDHDENPIDALFRMMIAVMIEMLPTELPALLIARFGNADQWTPEYLDRFCLGVYLTAISIPHHMLKMVGFFGLVKMLLDGDRRETFTPERALETFRNGFAEFSPTFRDAITAEMIILTAKLVTLDWLKNGDIPDDSEKADQDSHVYFSAVMEHLGIKPDQETVMNEAVEYLADAPADELENLRPEAIEMIRRLREQRGDQGE